MRDKTVVATLNVLEKLESWLHSSNYIMNEVKMAIVKEWGDLISFESLTARNLEMKLTFCEDLEKVMDVLEGSQSRTKGFIVISYLKTLDYMKRNNIAIGQDRLKRVSPLKKELCEIFKNDSGAPVDFNSYTSL